VLHSLEVAHLSSRSSTIAALLLFDDDREEPQIRASAVTRLDFNHEPTVLLMMARKTVAFSIAQPLVCAILAFTRQIGVFSPCSYTLKSVSER
jgi:hypothetical protein